MLGSIARATGLTYNEVNIIVYYMLVPLMWTAMLDNMYRETDLHYPLCRCLDNIAYC